MHRNTIKHTNQSFHTLKNLKYMNYAISSQHIFFCGNWEVKISFDFKSFRISAKISLQSLFLAFLVLFSLIVCTAKTRQTTFKVFVISLNFIYTLIYNYSVAVKEKVTRQCVEFHHSSCSILQIE